MSLPCSHCSLLLSSCLSDHLNALVGQKAAVGITCPYTSPNGSGSCPCELSTGTIQSVLTPADFESYLNATLMSFIESDDCLTVTCPNAKCASLMSVEPLANRDVPQVITEKDEDGRVLTKETFLHFKEFRVRSVTLRARKSEYDAIDSNRFWQPLTAVLLFVRMRSSRSVAASVRRTSAPSAKRSRTTRATRARDSRSTRRRGVSGLLRRAMARPASGRWASVFARRAWR